MTEKKARFITGSTWRHVITMTLTNSIGLMTLFTVDLIDLYFLNQIGEQAMAAAVGFSAQILFFVTALSIGLLISVGILVSQRIGAQNTEAARRISVSAMIFAAILVASLSIVLIIFLDNILDILGATGKTHQLATIYSNIILPSSTLLVMGMIAGAILRATGDARRSMNATLIAATVNLAFDPLLIFYFDMGIAGAAWASVLARIAMLTYALYGVGKVHAMFTRPTLTGIKNDFLPIVRLAIPAMLTNLATPVGSTFVTITMAKYGDAAVAAYATIGRIIPVAFSVLFALSGAISPIIGQNYGAKQFKRVQQTYYNAIIFTSGVVISMSLILFIGQNYLVQAFKFSGEAASLIHLFCSGLTLFFVTDGILFSTNSTFNSLGYPLYSTFFNYAKFFLGVIPSVWILSYFYQAQGVIIGQAIGPIIISIAAVITCNHTIKRLHKNNIKEEQKLSPRTPLWQASSSKTQL